MNILKKTRFKAGLSVEQVAKGIGVSTGAVYDWESGKCKPSAKNFAKFARVCGCTTEEIIELYE